MNRRLTPVPILAALTALVLSGAVAGAPAAGAPHRTRVPAGADSRAGRAAPPGMVVWTRRTAAGPEHLMVARADGSHARWLTRPAPDTNDIEAQVSPDGRWVAYEKDLPESASIHLVHPDGSDDHVLDVGCADPCVAAASPTWTSNHRLSFILVKGPFDEATGTAASAVLWSIRRDGTGFHRVSEAGIDGRFEESYLHVAPDRSYQTFRRVDTATGDAAVFRQDLPGGHLTQLTPWGLRAEVEDLSTARHGRTKDRLVFESYGRGDPDATFVDIATVRATCRSLARCTDRIHWLTDNAATGRRNANPQWSPSGKQLVFTDRASIDVGNVEIWTMRYGSDRRHRVTRSPAFDYRPTWGAARR